ncbi:MAG TPA: hypothetical protein VFE34_03270 [Dongiaceae bacterium]|jgi:hypothetical protein|nr:hypothetical protein [Dongiaceae bacterium]
MPRERKKSFQSKRFYLPRAKLPPRFVAWWFSDEDLEIEITSETIRDWRKAGYFGPEAKRSERHRFTWEELLTACGAWSPKGSMRDLQRQPYTSETVAAELGLSHDTALDRFRKKKIPGGFKVGMYWYARAAEFDAGRPLV